MIDYTLDKEHSILHLRPASSLTKEDFAAAQARADELADAE